MRKKELDSTDHTFSSSINQKIVFLQLTLDPPPRARPELTIAERPRKAELGFAT